MKFYKIMVDAVSADSVDSKFAEKLLVLDSAYPKPAEMSNPKKRKCEYTSATLFDFLTEAEKGLIKIPEYQRNGDRHNANLGKWLEYTLINGLPMPNIILVKSDGQECWGLADGQQRIKALMELISKYDAVISKCTADIPTAEKDSKDSLEKLKTTFENLKKNLLACRIPVTKISGITKDEQLYIYSAFNAAKPQTGGEKAYAYLPESALPVVYDATKDLMPIYNKTAGIPAVYIWSALQAPVGKAIAGAKIFPQLKANSLGEKYTPCTLPTWWAALVDGIKARPTDNKVDMPQSVFAKAGYIVPLVQGIRLWGKADQAPDVITYLLKNLNKYLGREVSIIDKPGNGKNGPTMSKRIATSFLSMSGSGAAVVYKRTQAWHKLLKLAEKDFDSDKAKEKTDEIFDAIDSAIDGAEKALDSGEE